MQQQIPLSPEAEVGERDGTLHVVLPDVAYQRLAIVNVVYVGLAATPDQPRAHQWVLIDAGIPGSASAIRRAAERRFGGPPSAIILTHGHFDHVGALTTLARTWNVPIYAHRYELPFLDGRRSYPAPNIRAGGGLMTLLSGFFPRGPLDIRERLMPLPPDGSVPPLPSWRWIATPGHTTGHISLWRERDRTLIAGDAFITTQQESVYGALTQTPTMHGPPMYFTPDWEEAHRSVRRLAALEPSVAITGHGRAIGGVELREKLHRLAREFLEVSVPLH